MMAKAMAARAPYRRARRPHAARHRACRGSRDLREGACRDQSRRPAAQMDHRHHARRCARPGNPHLHQLSPPLTFGTCGNDPLTTIRQCRARWVPATVGIPVAPSRASPRSGESRPAKPGGPGGSRSAGGRATATPGKGQDRSAAWIADIPGLGVGAVECRAGALVQESGNALARRVRWCRRVLAKPAIRRVSGSFVFRPPSDSFGGRAAPARPSVARCDIGNYILFPPLRLPLI
jgi:hypothetical protein